MRTVLCVPAALIAFAAVSGCATEWWPSYMATAAAGPSASTVRAPKRDNVSTIDPGNRLPQNEARWIGFWSGWYGAGRLGENNLAVTDVRQGHVRVDWSYALDGRTGWTEVLGRFEDGVLVVSFPNGTEMRYRMRANGKELDAAMRGYKGIMSYGVLGRAEPWGLP